MFSFIVCRSQPRSTRRSSPRGEGCLLSAHQLNGKSRVSKQSTFESIHERRGLVIHPADHRAHLHRRPAEIEREVCKGAAGVRASAIPANNSDRVREVSDALVQFRKVREIRAQQELLITTLQDRSRLAHLRYEGGVNSLLDALDADRELFNAELSLAQTKRNELLSLVQLYKALGGGWQE